MSNSVFQKHYFRFTQEKASCFTKASSKKTSKKFVKSIFDNFRLTKEDTLPVLRRFFTGVFEEKIWNSVSEKFVKLILHNFRLSEDKLPVLRRLFLFFSMKTSEKFVKSILDNFRCTKEDTFPVYESFFIGVFEENIWNSVTEKFVKLIQHNFRFTQEKASGFTKAFPVFFQRKHLKNSSKVFLTTSGSPK